MDLNPENMKWLNPPIEWYIEDQQLIMFPNPESDFWRKTYYGFTFDSGSFYYSTCKGDFEINAKITGNYKTQYDQMGIMIRLNEKIWVKTGIEFVNEQMNISAVVTHEYSDWNMIVLDSNPKSIWIRVKRRKDALEIYYSPDHSTYQLMRIAYFPEKTPCQVGLMAASPKGNGFKAIFEDFTIKKI